MFPNGANKAITFSYDDGVVQDIRLIEIFNKYNLKATFNLNSGLLGKEGSLVRNGKNINHTKVSKNDVRHIYQGHEIAAHTLTHPRLTNISDDSEIIRQVENDCVALSELAGYEVLGMAYPCGGVNCNKHVADIVKANTSIKYARTVSVTKSFEPFCDLYQFKGTLYHHENWDLLFEMGKEFIELKTSAPKIFYIWGHSFEFDIYPERWKQFEEFCRLISNDKNIFYGTNLEVLISS